MSYNDSCPGNNSHEEIRNQRCYNHHEALYNRNAGTRIKTVVDIVRKFRPKFHHVVSNGPGRNCNSNQEWKRRKEVG